MEAEKRKRRFCTEFFLFLFFISFHFFFILQFDHLFTLLPRTTKEYKKRERKKDSERETKEKNSFHAFYRTSIASAASAAAAAAASFLSLSAAATSSSVPTTCPLPEQLRLACCPFPAHSGQSVHLAARGAEKGCQRTALRPWQTQQRRLPGEEVEEVEESPQQLLQGTILLACRALTATRITADVAVETASVAPPRAARVPPKPTSARRAGDRIDVFGLGDVNFSAA